MYYVYIILSKIPFGTGKINRVVILHMRVSIANCMYACTMTNICTSMKYSKRIKYLVAFDNFVKFNISTTIMEIVPGMTPTASVLD